ncbi:MAG: exosortase system-associated protein, TIGR04073 family [bacterium]|nr:exosortase system-associated protein, TIGR04073 family [bacterium]
MDKRREPMRNVMLVLSAVVVLAAGPVFAQQSEGKAQTNPEAIHDQVTRGIANVLTGWMDLPKQIVEESVEGDENILWPLTGAAKGVVEAGARTAVGAAEIVTSPAATPQTKSPSDPEVFDPEDRVTTAREAVK